MLCYVMLCYVMLCYVMLCYVMLCYIIFFLISAVKATLGSFSTLPAVSCQEIKDSSGGLVPSGRYWIDPEGSGNQSTTAYCDMKRGGE